MLFDVTIIGAGIVGLATAYQLQNLSSNAPSPAATASLSVGETIAELVLKSYFELK